jgi:hypothetical protein
MDVEKRTTIVAGMNAEPMKQGLREIATEATKTMQQITQTSSAMGRQLLDASRGFDVIARKFIDGYAEAQKYAQTIQTLQKAFANGRDLGMYKTVMEAVEKGFGTAGTAAKQFAETMGAVGTTAEQRVRALQQLVQVMQAVRRGQAEMVADVRGAPPPPTPQPRVTQQQRDILQAIATGRVDIQGLATLGYDRTLGGQGASAAIRDLRAQGLLAQSRIGGRFGAMQLTGGTAYGLAGVTPPPGTAGAELYGEQLARSFQAFQQRQQQAIPSPSQFGVQGPSYVNRAARQQELEGVFASVMEQEVQVARAAANAANVRRGTDQFGPITLAQSQAENMRYGSEQFGPITMAQVEAARRAANAANVRYGTEQFGPITQAQSQAANARYGSEQFGPITQAQAQAANTRMGTVQFGPISPEDVAKQAAALDALAAKYSPLAAAALSYKKTMEGVAEAEKLAAISATEAAEARNRAAVSMMRAEAAAVSGMNELRAAIDPVYRASKEYETELRFVEAAAAKLGFTHKQTQAALERVTAGYAASNPALKAHGTTLSQLTGTTGQTQFAMRQLGVQAVQTFQGFATGQPIFMTLIQQGHQIIDVMLSAGVSVKALGTAIANTFNAIMGWITKNPFVLIVAGIVAIAASLALITVRAEQAAQRLSDLGNRLRAVGGDFATRSARAADVEAASRQLAATTPIARADAFTAGSTLVTAGFEGSRDALQQMIKLAYDLSKVLGSDLPTATKILADGIDDAAGAAQKLRDQVGSRFPGLTQAAIDQLRLTQQTDGTAAAYQKLQQIIRQTASGAGDETTKLATAWHKFVEELTSTHGAIGGIGTFLGNMLATLLDIVRKILETLDKVREFGDWVDRHVPALAAIDRKVGLGGGAEAGQNLVGLRPTGATKGFQTFGTPEESIAAGVRQLQINMDQHKITTLAQQITKWAPPNENDTAAYIKAVVAETGIDPNAPLNVHDKEVARQVIQAIANRETGHKVAPEIISKGLDQAFAGTPSTNLGGVSQEDINKATQASKDALSVRIRDNQAAQQDMQRNIDAALVRAKQALATPGGEEAFKTASAEAIRYSEILNKLRGDATDLITEQQKMTRSLEDANRPLAATAGAARDLAMEEERYREAARAANGGIVDQTALTAGLNAVKARHLSELKDTVDALDRETNAQNALTTATEIGGKFLEHSANFERATVDALKYGAQGTKEYATAVTALTEAYDRNSEAKRTNAAASMIQELSKQNEQLQLEARLIGATTEEINRQTAALQARQAMNLKPGETPNAEQQRALDAAKQTADLKTQVDKQKAGFQELQDFGTTAANTIGDAMVASFQKGADAAKVWSDALGSIVNDVIKEFSKLAIVNPLLNALFGGGRPELGDVGGALSKLGGGDKTAANDNVASDALKALTGTTGGLPIDAAMNAMRVISVGGGGLGLPGIGNGAGVPGMGSDGLPLPIPPVPPGLGSDGLPLPIPPIPPTDITINNTSAADDSLAKLPVDVATGALKVAPAVSGLGGGGILSWLGGLLGLGGGGGAGAGATASLGGGSSGGGLGGLLSSLFGGGRGAGSPKAGSSGGGDLLSQIAGHAGGLFGWIPDQIFGEGFYKAGGFLGPGYLGLTGGSGAGALPSGMPSLDSLAQSSQTLADALPAPLSTDLPGLYHTGGLVGTDTVPYRSTAASAFDLAPHFQHGFANDEFAAILHRSERVLTANQNSRLEGVLGHVASGDREGHGGGAPAGNVVFNISTPDANSFRSSQPQITARAAAGISRTVQRNRM